MIKIRRGPDGLHLFDRDSGINLLMDDQLIEPEFWTDSPRQISIALTNACNLSCIHCYAPKNEAFLPLTQLKTWLTELDNAGCFGVGFGGGEPTIYKDFIELCRFGHCETALAISFTTHALSLSKTFVDQIKPYVNFVRVSMDGMGCIYESIRGKSFDLFSKKINLLKGNIPFGINYVVNDASFSVIDDALYFAQKVGAEEFLLLPEQNVGRGIGVDNVTLKKLQSWIDKYNGVIRLAISSQYQDFVESLNILQAEPQHIAYAHIDATGQIKKSSFDFSGEKIDTNGVIKAYRRLISRGKIR